MSVTPIEDVRALVNTSLTDDQLQGVIDREEAWLEGRIGQLVGPRTNVLRPRADDPIWIPRRTDAVTVTVNGDELAADQFEFSPSLGLLRAAPAGWPARYVSWSGPVELTWTPTDEPEVQAAVIELVGMTTESAAAGSLQSETIGAYSYTRSASTDRRSRGDVARSILLRRPAYSARIRAGWDAGLDRAVGGWWPR